MRGGTRGQGGAARASLIGTEHMGDQLKDAGNETRTEGDEPSAFPLPKHPEERLRKEIARRFHAYH